MQLTLWTYEGPPHVGAMRIATAMRDVHYVLHAPQGDTYADLLFTRPGASWTRIVSQCWLRDQTSRCKHKKYKKFHRVFKSPFILRGCSRSYVQCSY